MQMELCLAGAVRVCSIVFCFFAGSWFVWVLLNGLLSDLISMSSGFAQLDFSFISIGFKGF